MFMQASHKFMKFTSRTIQYEYVAVYTVVHTERTGTVLPSNYTMHMKVKQYLQTKKHPYTQYSSQRNDGSLFFGRR